MARWVPANPDGLHSGLNFLLILWPTAQGNQTLLVCKFMQVGDLESADRRALLFDKLRVVLQAHALARLDPRDLARLLCATRSFNACVSELCTTGAWRAAVSKHLPGDFSAQSSPAELLRALQGSLSHAVTNGRYQKRLVNEVSVVAVARSGTFFAVCRRSPQSKHKMENEALQLGLYAADSAQLLCQLELGFKDLLPERCMGFSADSKQLTVCGINGPNGRFRILWQTADLHDPAQARIAALKHGPVSYNHNSLSPNGQYLAIFRRGWLDGLAPVQLYNLRTPGPAAYPAFRSLQLSFGHGMSKSIVWSDCGNMLASSYDCVKTTGGLQSGFGVVSLLSAHACITDLPEPLDSPLIATSFSPDGQYLATLLSNSLAERAELEDVTPFHAMYPRDACIIDIDARAIILRVSGNEVTGGAEPEISFSSTSSRAAVLVRQFDKNRHHDEVDWSLNDKLQIYDLSSGQLLVIRQICSGCIPIGFANDNFVVSLYNCYEESAFVDRLSIFGCKEDSSDDAWIELHNDQDQNQVEVRADVPDSALPGFIDWVQGGFIAVRMVEGLVMGGEQALQLVLVTIA